MGLKPGLSVTTSKPDGVSLTHHHHESLPMQGLRRFIGTGGLGCGSEIPLDGWFRVGRGWWNSSRQ
jgi:hypothetical protein